jgi:hypothetical protein
VVQPAYQVQVQYEQRTAVYASQFVINAGEDELVLDCSSGVVLEAADATPQLPIHTRLAMSWGAARKLSKLLEQALRQHAESASGNSLGSATGGPAPYAKLPTMPLTHDQHS